MRELIRLEDVHRAFGALTVLDGINLRIDEGDRIGVVGHNGAGKTTLLRTISNQDQDLGDITFAAGLRLAFLTQIRDIVEEATLGEELNRRGRQFQELEDEISKIEQMMADPGKSIKFVGNQPFNHTLPLKSTPYAGSSEAAGYDNPYRNLNVKMCTVLVT